jgi:adenine-specific DNA-methyltransferase
MPKKPAAKKTVETLKHKEDKRKNIPTAEFQSVLKTGQQLPVELRYPRNTDLDPQLVWRGKDELDWSDLVVYAPPLYIQEKVHPKVLIDDLLRQTRAQREETAPRLDLFADFNGMPKGVDKTEFYQHDQNWSNRIILGDSLQVMASLAEREGLRGKVQCIYLDPPYGIRFNSNFQWSTTSRDVKDGNANHITREPEQVKAFRDTWRDGIHSYLTYLRDRLTVARDLLTDSGSIFVQIGDENAHRVRALMDEVFGEDNFVAQIDFQTTSSRGSDQVDSVLNYLLWYAKRKGAIKVRKLYTRKGGDAGIGQFDYVRDESGLVAPVPDDADRGLLTNRLLAHTDTTSQGETKTGDYPFRFQGAEFSPPSNRHWSQSKDGMQRLLLADRLFSSGRRLRAIRYLRDSTAVQYANVWTDTVISGFAERKVYVVQTSTLVVQRCLLMTTAPGDLVLDPTCGSGTTAFVAEQWGRRWITIDTSRVALALARARIMGARYPFYLLADSREGQIKEGEVSGAAPSTQPVHGDVRHGFVYERVPQITLKSIANNAEIDVVWERWQAKLEPLRAKLSGALKKTWDEWDIPRDADAKWPAAAKALHAEWWEARIARQKEIDASIAAKAEFAHLYDRPYEDKKRVRVAGPFTVESLSPHRVLAVDENDNLIDPLDPPGTPAGERQGFVQMILDNLKTSGVQQAHKEDRIAFTSLAPWPGKYYICAEGRYIEGKEDTGRSRRAAVFIGPEFGTVSRPDLLDAAREAGDAGFDVLIACAFNFDAHSSDFASLGKIPVLKARMNADLHMADDLKNTGKGNLFVIFGAPDIEILDAGQEGEPGQMRV